jgi:hypothetical protein
MEPPAAGPPADAADAPSRSGSCAGGGGSKGKGAAAGEAAAEWGQEECSICMDSGAEVVLRPCAHTLCLQCAWRVCAREVATCPYCRQDIGGVGAISGARGREGGGPEAAVVGEEGGAVQAAC